MIHWQYIKGSYQNSSSVENIPYTFFDFYGGNDYDSSSTAVTQEMLPIIQIASDTNRGNIHPAGHIITSGIEQNFTAWITFTAGIYADILRETSNDHEIIFHANNGKLYLGKTFNQIEIGYSQSQSILSGRWMITDYLKMSGATSMANPAVGDIVTKALYSDTICRAQYFDATSDRRAKTDIKPINQSVLPLVINTQLYSFKYKDLDTPSIGIIAQDIQDVDFDGFSLVDNKEATGQDMDYMSIHESKLVYILWKAVQEQQVEIEELKRQLKKD